MLSKDRLRKKYFLKRKNNYFDIKPVFFNPLIKLIRKNYNNKKNINLSLYYPASFEVNVMKLYETDIVKKLKTSLPVLVDNNSMRFYKYKKKCNSI